MDTGDVWVKKQEIPLNQAYVQDGKSSKKWNCWGGEWPDHEEPCRPWQEFLFYKQWDSPKDFKRIDQTCILFRKIALIAEWEIRGCKAQRQGKVASWETILVILIIERWRWSDWIETVERKMGALEKNEEIKLTGLGDWPEAVDSPGKVQRRNLR